MIGKLFPDKIQIFEFYNIRNERSLTSQIRYQLLEFINISMLAYSISAYAVDMRHSIKMLVN